MSIQQMKDDANKEMEANGLRSLDVKLPVDEKHDMLRSVVLWIVILMLILLLIAHLFDHRKPHDQHRTIRAVASQM